MFTGAYYWTMVSGTYQLATPSPVKMSDVRDGLSNAIAMSERPGGGEGRGVRTNTAYGATDDPATCLTCVLGGEYIPSARLTPWSPGIFWSFGRLHHDFFGTLLPPNGPSCWSSGNSNPFSVYSGVATAGSHHPGGADGLIADGSVRFFSETISSVGGESGYGVGGALGTRAGGETLGEF